jgi:hypothetical protein
MYSAAQIPASSFQARKPATMQGKPLLYAGIIVAVLLVAKDISFSILPDTASNGSLWSTPANAVSRCHLGSVHATLQGELQEQGTMWACLITGH